MFDTITLRGRTGAIAWGYYTVATVGAWSVHKSREGKWTLSARLARADRVMLARASRDRDRPPLFTAPRPNGQFCWPIRASQIGETSMIATLGPLEY